MATIALRPLDAVFVMALAGALAACGTARTLNTDPEAVQIVTADVERFWSAYDSLSPTSTRADSVRAFERQYLGPGSAGLRAFTRLRIESAEALVDAVSTHRRYYRDIRANTLRASESAPAIRDAFRGLQRIYPEARFPDVTLVVGRLTSAGVATDAGLQIGLELLTRDADTPTDELSAWELAATSSTGAVPCVVSHELVHYQQAPMRDRSLLAQSLLEGIAEFVGELAAGCRGSSPAAWEWAEDRETEVWASFEPAMGGRDYAGWLYSPPAADGRPADVGYWVGYQIARSYYGRASDKRAAVRAMLSVRDPKAFLAESGYAP